MKRMLFYGIFAVTVMIWVEQVAHVSYLIKTGLKLVLFLAVPILLFRRFTWLKREPLSRRKINGITAIGLIITIIIWSAFFVLSPYVEWSKMIDDVQNRLGVTPMIFPFIALYISFGNSLIEEIFFRGFLQKSLERNGFWKTTIASSALFAVYHLAMFFTWFDSAILILCLVALFVTGVGLCLLNRSEKHIFASWYVHILADLAIMSIAIRLFYF